MHAPTRPKTNEPPFPERRASREITAGLGSEIESLHQLSAPRRVREFAFFIALYAIGAAAAFHSDLSVAFFLVGMVFMGAAFNSLGVLIHEGLHGLLAKHPNNNHLLSFLVGLPIGMSATAYQITHNNHHFHLGRKLDFGTYRQHVKKPWLVWVAYFAQLFFGTILYVALIPFVAFSSASRSSRLWIIAEYCVIVATFASVFLSVPIASILLYWGYPIIVMSVMTNIRGLASHALGDVENIYLSSRTITSSKIVSTLFLYENYHLEHHLFPGIPSYNLSRTHALIWDRLPEALYSQSYLWFLLGFFRAAFKNNLQPMGVVHPIDGRVKRHRSRGRG